MKKKCSGALNLGLSTTFLASMPYSHHFCTIRVQFNSVTYIDI